MSIIAQSIARIGLGFGQKAVSTIGFLNEENTGRSGYWRLFFTQLQEQSEKKAENDTASVHGAERVVLSEQHEVTRLKKPSRQRTATPAPVEQLIPPFKPIQPFKQLPLDTTALDGLRILQEVALLRTQYTQLTIQALHQQAASNDEDDIELLLFVA